MVESNWRFLANKLNRPFESQQNWKLWIESGSPINSIDNIVLCPWPSSDLIGTNLHFFSMFSFSWFLLALNLLIYLIKSFDNSLNLQIFFSEMVWQGFNEEIELTIVQKTGSSLVFNDIASSRLKTGISRSSFRYRTAWRRFEH